MSPSLLVVNAHARSGRDTFEQARDALTERGVRLVDAVPLEDPSTLEARIRTALATGVRSFVVGGGDGSLNAAANVLGGTGAALGVLPLGTANDFARSIHVPHDLVQACEVIARGRRTQVDLGTANGRRFLNATSLGLTSEVAKQIRPAAKKHLGKLAYATTAAAEAMKLKPFRVKLASEQEARELNCVQLVIGNGRYHGGGRKIAPGASVQDAMLDFYAVTAPTSGDESLTVRDLGTLARVGLLLRRGRHLEHGAVLHLRTRNLQIDCEPAMELDVDGEVCGTTPAEFRVEPRALTVYA